MQSSKSFGFCGLSLARNSAVTSGLGPTVCGISREKLLEVVDGSKPAGPPGSDNSWGTQSSLTQSKKLEA